MVRVPILSHTLEYISDSIEKPRALFIYFWPDSPPLAPAQLIIHRDISAAHIVQFLQAAYSCEYAPPLVSLIVGKTLPCSTHVTGSEASQTCIALFFSFPINELLVSCGNKVLFHVEGPSFFSFSLFKPI